MIDPIAKLSVSRQAIVLGISRGSVYYKPNHLCRLLREHWPEITGRYHKDALWSPSYFAASCGGALLPLIADIADYIKSQREAAKGRSRVPSLPEERGIPRDF